MEPKEKDSAAPEQAQQNEDSKELTLQDALEQIEQIKKSQAGTSKSNAELAKSIKEKDELIKQIKQEKEDALKAKMDADELKKFEQEKTQKELDALSAALKKEKMDLLIVKGLEENKLSSKLARLSYGQTEEEVQENIKVLRDVVFEEAARLSNETLNSTTKPKSGEPAKGNAVVDYSKLSPGEAFRLQEKLAREGKL